MTSQDRQSRLPSILTWYQSYSSTKYLAMASSSSIANSHPSPFGPAISEKLTRDNFLLWNT